MPDLSRLKVLYSGQKIVFAEITVMSNYIRSEVDYFPKVSITETLVRGGAERNAVNALFKRKCYDIIKIAMINIQKN
jgi:DNA polymerase I-like protein with 3'-5' exonuclease and polymerase domains